MDRSLKWRTVVLILATMLCVLILLPSFVPRSELPPWYNWMFKSRMSMGLDLQDGLHLVYSIDLNKAVDDRASELKRDLEARFADEGVKAAVRTPYSPLGAVTIVLDDASKKDAVRKQIEGDYGDTITFIECPKEDGAKAICFRVSSSYADGIKK